MIDLLMALGLLTVGACIGAGAALLYLVKSEIRDGDRPLPPYDGDHEGWS